MAKDLIRQTLKILIPAVDHLNLAREWTYPDRKLTQSELIEDALAALMQREGLSYEVLDRRRSAATLGHSNGN